MKNPLGEGFNFNPGEYMRNDDDSRTDSNGAEPREVALVADQGEYIGNSGDLTLKSFHYTEFDPQSWEYAYSTLEVNEYLWTPPELKEPAQAPGMPPGMQENLEKHVLPADRPVPPEDDTVEVEKKIVSIDGVDSSYTPPSITSDMFRELDPAIVSINGINSLHEFNMRTDVPEIIGVFNSSDFTKDNGFFELITASILKEQISEDSYRMIYDAMSKNASDDLEKSSERVKLVEEQLSSEVKSLQRYRELIDRAVRTLSLHNSQSEVGSLVQNYLAQVLTPEDLRITEIPGTMYNLVNVLTQDSLDTITKQYSSTRIYFSILKFIFDSYIGVGAWNDSDVERPASAPFKHYGASGNKRFSRVRLLKRNSYEIDLDNVFFDGLNDSDGLMPGSKTTAFGGAIADRAVRNKHVFRHIGGTARGGQPAMPLIQGIRGIFDEGIRKTSEQKKDIVEMLCMLSNELLVSAGIKSLEGTELGNKYSVVANSAVDDNFFAPHLAIGDAYAPLEKVLGYNYGRPNEGPATGIATPWFNLVDIIDSGERVVKGTLTDFMSAKMTDTPLVTNVAVFENSDVRLSNASDGNKAYVQALSGADYLIEGPARVMSSENQTGILFAKNSAHTYFKEFKEEADSARIHLEKLMCLRDSTSLSPQGLMIRILKDVHTIVSEGTKEIGGDPDKGPNTNLLKSAMCLVAAKPPESLEDLGITTVIQKSDLDALDHDAFIRIAEGSDYNARRQSDQYIVAIGYHRNALDLIMMVNNHLERYGSQPYQLGYSQESLEAMDDDRIGRVFGSRGLLKHVFENGWMMHQSGNLGFVRDSGFVYGQIEGFFDDKAGNTTDLKAEMVVDSISSPFDFHSESVNVYHMIMDMTEEIMFEAHALSEGKGSRSSYKNASGCTAFTGMDYTQVLAMVHHLYHHFINLFFAFSVGPSAGPGGKSTLYCLREKNIETSAVLGAILNSYAEGQPLDGIFDREGNITVDLFNTSDTGVNIKTLGRNEAIGLPAIGQSTTPGDLIEILNDLKKHRSYIKAAVGAMSVIPNNIFMKTKELFEFRNRTNDILSGKTKIENVKDDHLKNFARLAKSPLGISAINGLTRSQANNTVVAAQLCKSMPGVEKKMYKDHLPEGWIRAIQLLNLDTDQADSPIPEEFRFQDILLCVGIPCGMLSHFRDDNVNDTIRKFPNNSGKVTLEFKKREETAPMPRYYDATPYRRPGPGNHDFDTELYLMTDSFDYLIPGNASDRIESKTSFVGRPVEEILQKTIFYKISAGRLVFRATGFEILASASYGVSRDHMINLIRSEIHRCILKFGMGVDISETSLKQKPSLNRFVFSKEGATLLDKLAKNRKIPFLQGERLKSGVTGQVLTENSADSDTKFYQLKSSNTAPWDEVGEAALCDVKRATKSAHFSAELNRYSTLEPSLFDRVYFVALSRNDWTINSYGDSSLFHSDRASFGVCKYDVCIRVPTTESDPPSLGQNDVYNRDSSEIFLVNFGGNDDDGQITLANPDYFY